MLYPLRFLFLSEFKHDNVLDGGAFSRDIFSFEFVAYQSLPRCQISCANKHKVEKTKTLVQFSLLEKF